MTDSAPGDRAQPFSQSAVGAAAKSAPVLLTVRPRRMAIWATIAATLVVGSMVVMGLLLKGMDAGVTFRLADQIGLIGIGLVMGTVIMTAARPRLRVDANGLWVRNLTWEAFVPWDQVTRVAFPVGSPWAQLVIPSEETKPVMAIQAMDRERALTALEALRALHGQYGPPPSPERPTAPPIELENGDRPLGRLEIIDRVKAEQGARDRERRAARARAKGVR